MEQKKIVLWKIKQNGYFHIFLFFLPIVSKEYTSHSDVGDLMAFYTSYVKN